MSRTNFKSSIGDAPDNPWFHNVGKKIVQFKLIGSWLPKMPFCQSFSSSSGVNVSDLFFFFPNP